MLVGLRAKRGAEQYATGRSDCDTTSAPRIIGAVTKKALDLDLDHPPSTRTSTRRGDGGEKRKRAPPILPLAQDAAKAPRSGVGKHPDRPDSPPSGVGNPSIRKSNKTPLPSNPNTSNGTTKNGVQTEPPPLPTRPFLAPYIRQRTKAGNR
ncbi:hypothetical protein V490_03924 [Pseudogymnoascus sp. VKM F-3557]|nr:hypothetical protein V490_03924 [Pseudogymnoascus sp. VKM F-3557]